MTNTDPRHDPIHHALAGHPDDTTIPDTDWPAYSAGYEAGLRDGIAMTRLQVSVELVPVGPPSAGIKLWRAQVAARLTERDTYPGPGLTGEQLRVQARASWGISTTPEQGHGRREGTA